MKHTPVAISDKKTIVEPGNSSANLPSYLASSLFSEGVAILTGTGLNSQLHARQDSLLPVLTVRSVGVLTPIRTPPENQYRSQSHWGRTWPDTPNGSWMESHTKTLRE